MDTTSTPFEALQRGVKIAGGQSATARICEVSQTAVWKWLQSSKRLPAEHVLRMEAATSIPRHVYRPDIYPPPRAADAIEVADGLGEVACDRHRKTQAKDAA